MSRDKTNITIHKKEQKSVMKGNFFLIIQLEVDYVITKKLDDNIFYIFSITLQVCTIIYMTHFIGYYCQVVRLIFRSKTKILDKKTLLDIVPTNHFD